MFTTQLKNILVMHENTIVNKHAMDHSVTAKDAEMEDFDPFSMLNKLKQRYSQTRQECISDTKAL